LILGDNPARQLELRCELAATVIAIQQEDDWRKFMKWAVRMSLALATVVIFFGGLSAPAAKAQAKKPNILFIMGDDVGWFHVGAYHQGIMS
jgi:hypothetical protein